MNRAIEQLEAEQMKPDLPLIEVGDTIRVHQRITEGEGKEQRTRVQVFEGVVIGLRGRGLNRMMTVRRVTYGIGVERTFPLHAPNLEKFEVTRKGDVRRAKLYYLRDRVGKAARVKARTRAPRPSVETEATPVATPPAVAKPAPVAAAEPEPVAVAEPEPVTVAEPESVAAPEPEVLPSDASSDAQSEASLAPEQASPESDDTPDA